MYSSWIPTNKSLVLLGATQRARGPSRRRPTRPYVVLVGTDQHTLGPPGRRPMRPWSSWVRPHTPLDLPGAALRQGTQSPSVRDRGHRKNATVATEEKELM